MKRWMESCTTVSGRGWKRGFGDIFEDSDLGRDPEHDILWFEEQGWGCSCVIGYLVETRKDGNEESGRVCGGRWLSGSACHSHF